MRINTNVDASIFELCDLERGQKQVAFKNFVRKKNQFICG